MLKAKSGKWITRSSPWQRTYKQLDIKSVSVSSELTVARPEINAKELNQKQISTLLLRS